MWADTSLFRFLNDFTVAWTLLVGLSHLAWLKILLALIAMSCLVLHQSVEKSIFESVPRDASYYCLYGTHFQRLREP